MELPATVTGSTSPITNQVRSRIAKTNVPMASLATAAMDVVNEVFKVGRV